MRPTIGAMTDWMAEPTVPILIPGWYPDDTGDAERYFDGTEWTSWRPVPTVPTVPERLSSEDRADLLDMELAHQLRPGFMLPPVRLESHTDHTAVLVYGSNPNHVVHALLTIVTCGAWLIVWLAVTAIQHEKRMTLQVDRYGIVTRD